MSRRRLLLLLVETLFLAAVLGIAVCSQPRETWPSVNGDSVVIEEGKP